MSGVNKPKLTSSIREDKRILIGENVRRDSYEWSHHQLDNEKLRESVLHKLWDSLPPETQILPHSNDEDSDSTQSGLEEGEFEGKESSKILSKTVSLKDFLKSPELKNKKIADISKDQNSRSKSRPQETEDSEISWDANLDFIQSIIWLKSTTAKLESVPADEFLKAFKNQWELSPKIRSPKNPAEIRGVSSKETKQREKLDLIKNRLASGIDENSIRGSKWDVLIPESDESENPSLQSSQCAPDRETNTRFSESVEISTIDSGFNSDKPESAEATNPSQYVIENSSKKRKAEDLEPRGVETLNLVPGVKSISARISEKKQDARPPKRPRLSISSAPLNYVLRSSECNAVLLNSVRVVLGVLENAGNGPYDLGRNWLDLVLREAVDAVVSIVDLLENEKGPNSCRNEVVAMVKRVLERMLNSSDVDKLTVWEHHRLVILELCNSPAVCREVVSSLISELNELIPVAMQTGKENMRRSLVVMDKSYILFHSLKVVLEKYRSVVSNRLSDGEENASQKIPEVTDLWKRHWKPAGIEPDIFVTGLETLEIPYDPEEIWTRVLEELVVVSTRVWPMVKILAWQCLAVLKSLGSNEARDG